MLYLAVVGSRLVSLRKLLVKSRDMAAVSAEGRVDCITPVPKSFKLSHNREHQLLWAAIRGSLFQCLPSRKLVAVIKIKQMSKWLALPSGIFIKKKICDWFRPK